MVYTDVWADTGPAPWPRAPMIVKYTGNANSADDLATAVPTNGIINYPTHIAPLWTRDRGAEHLHRLPQRPGQARPARTTAGTGRVTSYEELLIGDPVIDSGHRVCRRSQIREGEPEVVRGTTAGRQHGRQCDGHDALEPPRAKSCTART